MCVCEKGNAYTHDEHVAFSRSSHVLIPNRGNLQVSTTSEAWRAWRALESLLKVGEDKRTALALFGESPTFPRGFKNAPLVWPYYFFLILLGIHATGYRYKLRKIIASLGKG